MTLLYVGLIATNEDGSIEPRLAKSWKRVDSRTWEFTLGEGVTFPDGTNVTATRVVASLCASMQPTNVQSWSLSSIEHETSESGKSIVCSGLIAKGANELLIRESSPTPWLFEALAGPAGWVTDPDPAKKGQYGVLPGIGPYVLQRVDPDQRVVLKRREAGAALSGKVGQITFEYIPDPSLASRTFENGMLDVLEIDTPQIADLALRSDGTLVRAGARLERFDVDRVRIVDFNLKRLEAKGFSPSQLRSLIEQYSRVVPRAEIVRRSRGLAAAMKTGFPPYDDASSATLSTPPSIMPTLPPLTLTLITENDPYSDEIAAMLPSKVGDVSIRYQTMDKNILIDALLKGDFDLSLIKLEATHHTPKFWAAFFTPGNAYSVFGEPIAGIDHIDLSKASGIRQAASLVASKGSWIGVLRELGLLASSEKIHGIRRTGSGQLSFESIEKSP